MIKFGTDGVRGVAGKDLQDFHIYCIGNAINKLFPNSNIVIGRDTRTSGLNFEKAFINGCKKIKVTRLGIVSSGCVGFCSKEFDLGVMITASHNGAEYNGIKFFKNGMKIDEQLEQKIEKYANEYCNKFNDNEYQYSAVHSRINRKKVQNYINFLKNCIKFNVKDINNVIIDCANGGACSIIESVFEDFKQKIKIINNYSNGKFINDNCGATNTKNLCKIVKKEKANFGFALDGDADRFVAVNKKGKEIDGSELLYNFAQFYNGYEQFEECVGTQYTNFAVVKKFNNGIIKFKNAGVGDRLVLFQLKKNKKGFGGEPSGHFIFYKLLPTGDGILSCIMFLNMMVAKNYKYKKVKLFKECNCKIECKDFCFLSNKDFCNEINKIKQENKNSKIIVRKSGTEPVVRINVEHKKKSKAKELLCSIKNIILKYL